MTKIPPYYSKAIVRSDEYWNDSAYIEDQNWGAPEDPYAPTYAKASRSATTKALSLAPKETNTLELSEALQYLMRATLEWTTQPSNKSGARQAIIKLNNKSVTIEYTYNFGSGIIYLKWGDKEIITNGNVKVTGITKEDMCELLEGLRIKWQYAKDSINPWNFVDLPILEDRVQDKLLMKGMFVNHRHTSRNRQQSGIPRRRTSF